MDQYVVSLAAGAVGLGIIAFGRLSRVARTPRVLFGLMLGFGVGGTAAEPLAEPWRLLVALMAAGAFEFFMFGPTWRFIFEPKPALTLASAIGKAARAIAGFDQIGSGLVAVDVDGEVVQLRATLSSEERERGVRIHGGDMVRIAEVDALRRRCVVTLPLA